MEKNYYKEQFESPTFLDQKKLKDRDDKIKSGETVCNLEAPEDCESCSG